MYRFLLILVALVFNPSAYAYQRIVLLAPAAGDIFNKLGAQDSIVGVTRNNFDFPNALKIGSHIKPNVELIKGLDPDLIIISSNRFFSQQMASVIDVDTLTYNPETLEEILSEINRYGAILEKQTQADELVAQLTQLLTELKPIAVPPKVVYEVTENPYIIAGKQSIIKSIIEHAGGKLFAPSNRKIAKFNIESVLMENPDFYIYQQGPMNKVPTPPADRKNFSLIDSQFIKVDQLSFSRATTDSFYHAMELNKRFIAHNKLSD